jgi:hypothetical protein
MITLEQYYGEWFGHPDITETVKGNVQRLLTACETLSRLAAEEGLVFPTNPATKSGVSGVKYGGFRPQSCTIGAPKSAHKEGLAVDRFDPSGAIDEWCINNQDLLEFCGIYIEHPSATVGWSHWSIKAPKSGKTVFYP